MATSRGNDDEMKKQVAELSKTLKEGERILPPTRRPDGTLRKAIRIRANFVPQEEQPVYQPKPALLRKEMASQSGPPGYDPDLDAKPKTKSVKRNERRKKEKQSQAAGDKEKNLDPTAAEDSRKNPAQSSESVQSVTSQMNALTVSPADSEENSEPIGAEQDIDKRLRALRKKIRQTEALQQKTATQDIKPEQLEKLAKLEDWLKELKQLEDKKAEASTEST